MNLPAALAYAERHTLQALLAVRDGETLLAHFAPGFDADTPHALYSGTKSFWGVAAVAAAADGRLDLDEPVAQTIAAWSDDPWKARVTLRELLNLTSGIGFGGLGTAVPTYDRALAVTLKDEPGQRFTYGGIPLQVFGAVLASKLAPLTPHAFLHERILAPLGLVVASWRTLADGTNPLPTGAFVAAREWSKYGELILGEGTYRGRHIVAADALARCFEGSAANARYGLGWWLSPLPTQPQIAYASGAGGQALYVIPSERTTIVKFGNGASYKHDVFLKRLLS